MLSHPIFPRTIVLKMSVSVSVRVSPQASKVLASESRSTGSDATVIRMRMKKSHPRKPSYYSMYNSKVIPLHYYGSRHNHHNEESFIVNIIHDAGGAKAPCLIFDETTGDP